jgi:hypothetical protein
VLLACLMLRTAPVWPRSTPEDRALCTGTRCRARVGGDKPALDSEPIRA